MPDNAPNVSRVPRSEYHRFMLGKPTRFHRDFRVFFFGLSITALILGEMSFALFQLRHAAALRIDLTIAVAAGDGAFKTWSIRFPSTMWKSSIKEPSRAIACARTPIRPRCKSPGSTPGIMLRSSRTSAALLQDRVCSPSP